MKTSLVILAAGIGSRFGGGIKQLEPVGPNGEIIMDYSIDDAVKAGFDKVVFIIRHDLEEDFKRVIGDRIEKKIEVAYAFQEIDALPEGYALPEGRKKPWGTSQALLCAADVIDEPFAVINADDYYGREAYGKIHEYLTTHAPMTDAGKQNMALVSFILRNTLSENGGVTRGICSRGEDGKLLGIAETKNIIKTPDGAAVMGDEGPIALDGDSLVSMNLWGFYPVFLETLKRGFPAFLDGLKNPLKDEYLLPVSVDSLLKSDLVNVEVLTSTDRWFGVTYQEDKQSVKEAFAELIAQGVYRSPL